MLLGALLFVVGLLLARFAARPARWLKIAGVVLFLGWPASQIGYGLYLGHRDAQALADG
jgi:hypothetical protein